MLNINPERILIIKPSSLGDIIHALPTLAALRSRFPKAWIVWLVKEQWAEILDGHPQLDEVVAANLNVTKWWGLLRTIRSKKFDLVVDLQGLFRSALIGKLSGASVVVGFAQGREGSPWLYTHCVELPMPKGQSWRLWNMHAVDRNLAVAKYLGAEWNTPEFCLPCGEDDRKQVDGWLKSCGVTDADQLIAIAPLTRQTIKNWPLDRFVKVAQALSKGDNIKILLVGTEDLAVGQIFETALGSRLVNLMGKTRVRQLRAVFDKARLLIANDSAPLHIASARGIPIVTIFGPTNPEATGPYGKQESHQILTHPLACRPCGQRTCQNVNALECLTSISVQEVVAQAERILRAVRP